MDFQLSDEQRDIKKAAREFSEGELREIARECDLKEEFPMSLLKKACDLGSIGVFIPEAYGGAGLGFLEHAFILEEFWKVDPVLGQELCSVTFGAEGLVLFGTEGQKKTYLRPLTTGKAIMGFSITEPDAGSDAGSVITSAQKDGDTYVINGSETARTVVHKACWSVDHGLIDTNLVAMAKWYACNVAIKVVDEAL